jgi:3-hydroxymyristoyl/3-hydroxydecanoyl-(acyl carrier protein) dehydratase
MACISGTLRLLDVGRATDKMLTMNEAISVLPCAAEGLVPQRPPMLLVARLVVRDRPGNFSVVEAVVPPAGIFVGADGDVLPEYFVELVAQAMAAVNGYDCLLDGEPAGRGFLVGIEDFRWHGSVAPGERLRVEMVKNFQFGPVTVMAGKVINGAGEVLAGGEIRAWEEK